MSLFGAGQVVPGHAKGSGEDAQWPLFLRQVGLTPEHVQIDAMALLDEAGRVIDAVSY